MVVNGIEIMATVKCSLCGADIWKKVNSFGATDIWDSRHHFTPSGNCCNRRDKNGC